MTETLDPRLNAFRPDLADARLEGRVQAERFVEGRMAEVSAPRAPLRRRPSGDAALDTQALFGETITVFEDDDEGWSWVQLSADGYVGYLPSAAIGVPGPASTHRVCVPRTLVFPGPDIKLPPLFDLTMGSSVRVKGTAEDHNARYALIEPAGAIVVQHLSPVGEHALDFVQVAEQFLGVPYLWGGKSADGLDCSALIQLPAAMAGIEVLRDTSQQALTLGTRIAGIEALRRGDLIFWKGHVGIMLDGTRLLHANAHHMMTAIEPLAQAMARISAKGSEITEVRRLGALGMTHAASAA